MRDIQTVDYTDAEYEQMSKVATWLFGEREAIAQVCFGPPLRRNKHIYNCKPRSSGRFCRIAFFWRELWVDVEQLWIYRILETPVHLWIAPRDRSTFCGRSGFSKLFNCRQTNRTTMEELRCTEQWCIVTSRWCDGWWRCMQIATSRIWISFLALFYVCFTCWHLDTCALFLVSKKEES